MNDLLGAARLFLALRKALQTHPLAMVSPAGEVHECDGSHPDWCHDNRHLVGFEGTKNGDYEPATGDEAIFDDEGRTALDHFKDTGWIRYKPNQGLELSHIHPGNVATVKALLAGMGQRNPNRTLYVDSSTSHRLGVDPRGRVDTRSIDQEAAMNKTEGLLKLLKNSTSIEIRAKNRGHKLGGWVPSKAIQGALEAVCQKCKSKVLAINNIGLGVVDRDCQHNDFHRTLLAKTLEAAHLLSKNHPTFTLPGLGLKDNPRETPIVNNTKELELKAKLATRLPGQPLVSNDIKAARYQRNMGMAINTPDASPSNEAHTISWAKGSALRVPKRQDHPLAVQSYADPTAPQTTKLHEDLHRMFARVSQRYGQDARQNLARKLYESIPLEDRINVDTYFMGRVPEQHPFYHEEKIAHMLNYLNNPGERAAWHGHQELIGRPLDERGISSSIKRAMKHLRRMAATVNESWLDA